MIRAVIFDLDDTIINTETHILPSLKSVFHNYSSNLGISESVFRKANEKALSKLLFLIRSSKLTLSQFSYLVWFETLHNLDIEPSPHLVIQLYGDLQNEILKRISINEGFGELLTLLRQQNYIIAILSNGLFSERINKLQRVGLLNSIDILLTSDLVGSDKPSLQPFNEMLSLLKIKAGEALYIGDSPTEDYLPARECNIHTALYSPMSNNVAMKNVRVVRSCNEILILLEKLNEKV